jgi:hypothetical protein
MALDKRGLVASGFGVIGCDMAVSPSVEGPHLSVVRLELIFGKSDRFKTKGRRMRAALVSWIDA